MMKGVRWGLCSSAFSIINWQKHSWISLPRTLPSPALKGQLKQCWISKTALLPWGWAGKGHFVKKGTWRKGFLCQIVPLCYLWVLSFRIRPQNPSVWIWFCFLVPTSSKVESCMDYGAQALAGDGDSWGLGLLSLLPSFNQNNFEQGVTKAVGESWPWWNGQNPGRIPVSIRWQEGSELPGQESQVSCWAWFHLRGSQVSKWIYLILGWLWGCLFVCLCWGAELKLHVFLGLW